MADPVDAPRREALPAANEPRPEIDGLRALAVLLVLLFHVRAPGASGGFVGVDIFFVISGFLISRSLVREAQRTGQIALGAFWARRARRLLPGATVVLCATTLGALAWLSPLAWRTFAIDLALTAGYGSNFGFALRASDYFDREVTTSPLLHTWSLGVEEQFYLVWPLLVAAGAWRAARRARAPGGTLAIVFSGVAIASFALSLAQTQSSPAWAYFGAPARAWEFACGGLLAFAPTPRDARARSALSITGGVLLVAAVSFIDERTAYPGLAALLPVGGALAWIAAGASSPSGRALSAKALQALGRRSYAIYLWHWPLIVFADLATPFGLVGRALAGALSLVLGHATHRYVENPLRFHPRLAAPRRALAFGAALAALAAAASLGVLAIEARARRDPELAPLFAARADRGGSGTGGECATLDPVALRARCSLGPQGGMPVLLLGDSHARHWQSALAPIARERGWRITYAGRGGCPSLPVRVNKGRAGEPARDCARWQDGVPGLIDALRPRWLIVANSGAHYFGRIDSPEGDPLEAAAQADVWRRAAERMLGEVRGRGIPLLWVLDTPRVPDDPVDCLAHRRSPAACAPARSAALAGIAATRAAEFAALASDGRAAVFDPLPFLCDERSCPVVIDGLLVYRDESHLTARFSRHLAPALDAAIRAAEARERSESRAF